ncbi:AraC family transcriptional regulator [Pontibacter sp. G13]|uniref:AraC family transcriptional regulator n=1 Tax=Pontibacter sp. G13 TaxID=3074898 RepID=UPI00288A304F|nr:AraC family transcriptional regulator [Pontibacter sp. G13]WNJ20225.1 AraC family transcriptional regulator [Pontibacter sp. G13]
MAKWVDRHIFTSEAAELMLHHHCSPEMESYQFDHLLYVYVQRGEKHIHFSGGHGLILQEGQLMMSSGQIQAEAKTPGADDGRPVHCVTLEIDSQKIEQVLDKVRARYELPWTTKTLNWSPGPCDVYQGPEASQIAQTVHKLQQIHTQDTMMKDYMIDLSVEELVLSTLQCDMRGRLLHHADQHAHVHPLAFAATFIQERLQSRIDLDDLADRASMSRPTFFRQFKQHFGMSPVSYIKQERLKAAKVLLADPAKSVASVSYEVGYSSPSYFIKHFRESYGMSPTAFRKVNL